MFNWVEGRQKSGYLKMTIFSFWCMDMHILKMPMRSSIDKHLDPIPNLWKGKYTKHHRLNIVLKHANHGGHFQLVNKKGYVEEDHWNAPLGPRKKRINYFIANEQRHKVTKVYKGTRYVLSIGWLT